MKVECLDASSRRRHKFSVVDYSLTCGPAGQTADFNLFYTYTIIGSVCYPRKSFCPNVLEIGFSCTYSPNIVENFGTLGQNHSYIDFECVDKPYEAKTIPCCRRSTSTHAHPRHVVDLHTRVDNQGIRIEALASLSYPSWVAGFEPMRIK